MQLQSCATFVNLRFFRGGTWICRQCRQICRRREIAHQQRKIAIVVNTGVVGMSESYGNEKRNESAFETMLILS
jgi:hypothetical protein